MGWLFFLDGEAPKEGAEQKAEGEKPAATEGAAATQEGQEGEGEEGEEGEGPVDGQDPNIRGDEDEIMSQEILVKLHSYLLCDKN